MNEAETSRPAWSLVLYVKRLCSCGCGMCCAEMYTVQRAFHMRSGHLEAVHARSPVVMAVMAATATTRASPSGSISRDAEPIGTRQMNRCCNLLFRLYILVPDSCRANNTSAPAGSSLSVIPPAAGPSRHGGVLCR